MSSGLWLISFPFLLVWFLLFETIRCGSFRIVLLSSNNRNLGLPMHDDSTAYSECDDIQNSSLKLQIFYQLYKLIYIHYT